MVTTADSSTDAHHTAYKQSGVDTAEAAPGSATSCDGCRALGRAKAWAA
jgi:hypothetical protein